MDFENQKLKQTFQSNRYPKDLVNRCIKMYLDKVFIKHLDLYCTKKGLRLCFRISRQIVIRNQKTTAKCY